MKRKRSNSGFSLAELLVVVAIIGALSAVSFISVTNYQKSTVRLEENTIAREIFVAAQNHLTLARNEGYLGVTDYGTLDSVYESDKGIYYYVVNEGFVGSPGSGMNDIMLPFGSIDETVRAGGSYLMRYQPSSGLVLDVFYCTPKSRNPRYGYDLSIDNYETLMQAANAASADDPRTANLVLRDGMTTSVVGWYGGEKAAELAQQIMNPTAASLYKAPELVVTNAEKLTVKVTNPNAAAEGMVLKLILVGDVSGAKQAIELSAISTDGSTGKDTSGRIQKETVATGTAYTVVLDDITVGALRFSKLKDWENKDGGSDRVVTTGAFIPGEDITVQAVVYNFSALNNVAYSDKEVTNSLFEKIEEKEVSVNNLRHLENLDEHTSGFDTDTLFGASTPPEKVLQTSDMDWTQFKTETDAEDTFTFTPVSPSYVLTYKGENHNIKNIEVNQTGPSGLFGTLASGSSVSDLALIDFKITAAFHTKDPSVDGDEDKPGDAGALAGKAVNCTVSNVVAYNTVAAEQDATRNLGIEGDGSAGGLIGSVSGGRIEKSAAALIVKSTGGNAGGLVGTMTNAAVVTGCFSGGHTKDGQYSKTDFNVTASTTAGGLVGDAGNASISYSYSTCSATGGSAGGFVGTATGAINHCYCTGLVKGTGTEGVSGVTYQKQGAFAYSASTTPTDCQYYEIINEEIAGGVIEYMKPLGKGEGYDNFGRLDDTASTYQIFVGDEPDWRAVHVYDATLTQYYGPGKFNLRTVKGLGATVTEYKAATPTTPEVKADYVVEHYGDWPAPEIFVFNTKT